MRILLTLALASVLASGCATAVGSPDYARPVASQPSAPQSATGQRPWAYDPDTGVHFFKCQGSEERRARYCRGPNGKTSI